MDSRLLAVAELIRASVHADIGTDHGLLPIYLLESRRVERVVVVEKHEGPYDRASRALEGYPAKVLRGDGFEPLDELELDSASICGMGGHLITRILNRRPETLPDRLFIQANRNSELVRSWALENGFHIDCEKLIPGYWNYPILGLARAPGRDPAYEGIPLELGLLYGPLLLKQREPLLLAELKERRDYFASKQASKELSRIEQALELLS